ncbi:BRO family protein [Nocardiopsis aegyptia]|uniref:BRO family protein n=1 Tax=Nocardiopsis aegyptia TaxID=220378 RepID=UPI00366BEFA7
MALQRWTFPRTGQQVRTLTIAGDPWFVARDACALLDITNSRMAVARLDEDGVSTADVIDSMGRTQQASIVNEAGLYELIFLSRKPEAKAFRRWVTGEVLPAIRRTGRYEAAPRELDRRALAEMVIAEADRADNAEQRAAALTPAAEAWEELADADGDHSVREAAQILSRTPGITIGQNRLFTTLRELRWIDGGGQPYQAQVDAGRLVRRTTSYTHPRTREPVLTAQVRVTPRGVAKLREVLAPGAQLALDAG